MAAAERPSQGGTAPRQGGSLRLADAGGAVPDQYFVGSTLSHGVASYVQFAWPLFLPSPTEPVPANALAESYEVSEDGLTHSFTIRTGVTFHDGSPLDAEAVAENYRSQFFADHPLRDEGSYLATLALGSPPAVDRVDVTDEHTFQVVLSRPNADLRRILWYFYIFNPAVMAREDYGTDVGALRDAGSGPFRVTNYSPSSFVELERFDGFFEDVYLDRLRIENATDASTMGLALRGGNLDVAVGLPKSDFDALAIDPAYQVWVGARPTVNSFLWWFYTPRISELMDPRVREAIWSAMNRDAYREAFYASGTSSASTQPVVVQGSRAFNPDLGDRPYDPDRARELLAEAGVENLQLQITDTQAGSYVGNLQQLYEAIAADLSAVGIELDLTVADEATAWESERDFHLDQFDDEDELLLTSLFFMGFEGGFEPPDPRGDAEVHRLFNAASEAPDADERSQHLQQLMKLNHDEIRMGIPIAAVAKAAISRGEVRDLRVVMTADPLHQAWIDES